MLNCRSNIVEVMQHDPEEVFQNILIGEQHTQSMDLKGCSMMGFFEDGYIYPGFNSQIPQLGQAGEWVDCHYCGNATAYRPTKCRKCNSTSFEQRSSRERQLSLAGVA